MFRPMFRHYDVALPYNPKAGVSPEVNQESGGSGKQERGKNRERLRSPFLTGVAVD